MSARRKLPPGLRLRGSVWTMEVRHKRLRSGRMVLSLRTEDATIAIERMAAIRSLMDRGDWKLIERLRTGGIHITDVVRGVREGDVAKLRRAGHDPTLLGDAVEAWLRTVSATLSDSTEKNYQVAADQLLDHFGSDFPMEDLTRESAEAWLHESKETTGKRWSARRQTWMATVAGALWRHAIEAEAERGSRLGYTPTFSANPWRAARTPEVRPTRVVFLTPPEWLDLTAAVAGQPHLAFLALAFLAGLRVQEIIHLRTGVDVVLEGAEPVIRVQSRAGEHPWRPKTSRSERDVPVSAELLAILEAHIEAGYAGDRYLIRLAGRDEPISYGTARRWTRDAYGAAGIKYGREGDGLTIHSGRHTFASWLAQRGVPLNIVADLLGDTMKVVYDTYAHLVPSTLREAVGVIDEAVQEGTESSTSEPAGGGDGRQR